MEHTYWSFKAFIDKEYLTDTSSSNFCVCLEWLLQPRYSDNSLMAKGWLKKLLVALISLPENPLSCLWTTISSLSILSLFTASLIKRLQMTSVFLSSPEMKQMEPKWQSSEIKLTGIFKQQFNYIQTEYQRPKCNLWHFLIKYI